MCWLHPRGVLRSAGTGVAAAAHPGREGALLSYTLAHVWWRRRTTGWQYGLLWGLIALLGLALIYPILLTVRGGFADDVATGRGFTLRHLAGVFSDPVLVAGW